MMSKFIRLVIIFLMVVAMAGLGGVARADSENSAVVVNGIYCTILDGNGNYNWIPDGRAVFSNDSNGNSMITCRGYVTPSATAKGAVIWNYENIGLPCSTTFGWTTNWQEVVTPSGQATLTCYINPSSQF